MRRVAVLLAAVVGASPAAAQKAASHPNFTGTWVLDTTLLGRQTGYLEATVTVKHTADSLRYKTKALTEQRTVESEIVAALDGKPTPQPSPAGTMTLTTTAIWAGDTLVVTTHGEGNGRAYDDVRRWRLSDPNTLGIYQTVVMQGKQVRAEGSMYRRSPP